MATTPGIASAQATVQGYRKWTYGPTLIGAANSTDAINTYAYPFGTLVAKLVAGTAPTSIVIQGSNDGGTTWVNLTPVVTAALPLLVSFGPGVVVGATAAQAFQAAPSGFELIRATIAGGDGTTSIQIDLVLSTPRG